jgi:Zn-finger nucleic acid-binding protein
MRCPNDSTELIVTERQGIDIRTCPTCRGTWLERGDLDEIINRSIPGGLTISADPPPQRERRGVLDRIEDAVEDRFDGDRRRRDKYSDDGYYDDDRSHRKKKGKRDLLEDLLDF